MIGAYAGNIAVLGEALIDVVNGQPHVGGSPLNVAVGTARLGHRVRFLSRHGTDEYGAMIERHLRDNRVDSVFPPDPLPTSVAVAQLDVSGAATYDFRLRWEMPGLSRAMDNVLVDTSLLHTGSIATGLEPGATQVLEAVTQARPTATITFDPNCRPTIIGDRDSARERAEAFVRLSDVVKASDEDLRWLYPDLTVEDAARAWQRMGPALVVMTRGAKGAWGVSAAGETAVPAVPVEVADTVGAGDSFMAALADGLAHAGLTGSRQREKLRRLPKKAMAHLLSQGARAAAITVSRPGANPPIRAEVEAS